MRELSEAEKEVRITAWIEYQKSEKLQGAGVTLGEKWAFNAGFNAGLEYAQSKIDELEVALEQALKVTHHAIETTKAVASDMSRISSKY